jgi:hypothetical protein
VNVDDRMTEVSCRIPVQLDFGGRAKPPNVSAAAATAAYTNQTPFTRPERTIMVDSQSSDLGEHIVEFGDSVVAREDSTA